MSEMVKRAADEIPDMRGLLDDEDRLLLAQRVLNAALDPPREEISAISDDSSVSFELVCSVLMALRRRAQGASVE